MAYSLELSQEAEEDLQKLGHEVALRIVKKLVWFAEQDHPLRFASPLTNTKIGDARFRIGDYRAVAVTNKEQKRIVIARIGHRGTIYR